MAAFSAPARSFRLPNGSAWCVCRLDHRVLELAVDEMVAAPALRASLNVSPASTIDPDWWSGLSSLLRTHAGVAERLIIETSEKRGPSRSVRRNTRLRVCRVKKIWAAALRSTDFGAGYTSFRNLRKLGVDIVKNRRRVRAAGHHSFGGRSRLRAHPHRPRQAPEIGHRRRMGAVTMPRPRPWKPGGCDYLQGALVGLASFDDFPWLPACPDPLARASFRAFPSS